ncbi:MAG TPA: lipoprotein [Steroidobacteraceae bacterium]|nr:lipoprotein [Steroidobacteraceae bacterium]
MRNTRLLVAAAVAGTLLGCGQKGPLVLPDAQHPHKKIGVGKPPAAPATSTPPPSGASPSNEAHAPDAAPSSGDAPDPATPGPARQP